MPSLVYNFRLAKPLPLFNVWERLHWRAKARFKKALAWEVTIGVHPLPKLALQTCEIEVDRVSFGTEPDRDGLYGSVKGLLDTLTLPIGRKKTGLGIIAADDSACIKKLTIVHQACKRGFEHTKVRIYSV